MKVLVTGAGALLGQGIIRSLRLSSLEAEIVAVDPSRYGVGLYWADRSRRIPLAADPAFMEALRGILTDERPDVLLVGTDPELPIIAPHRQSLRTELGVAAIVSDPRVVAIADDKYLTFRFLREHGLPYPDSALPDEADALVERVGYPLIVKPRIGARSLDVVRVDTPSELRSALAAVPGAMVQEHVSTAEEEYTAGVVSFPGQNGAAIVMRRHLRDGNTYRAFVVQEPELDDFVLNVARVLQPYGPVNFQFRLDAGVPKIFEINARFSGTTPLRARAGFNEVEMAIRYVLSGTPIQQPVVQPVSFLRYWDELMLDNATLSD